MPSKFHLAPGISECIVSLVFAVCKQWASLVRTILDVTELQKLFKGMWSVFVIDDNFRLNVSIAFLDDIPKFVRIQKIFIKSLIFCLFLTSPNYKTV